MQECDFRRKIDNFGVQYRRKTGLYNLLTDRSTSICDWTPLQLCVYVLVNLTRSVNRAASEKTRVAARPTSFVTRLQLNSKSSVCRPSFSFDRLVVAVLLLRRVSVEVVTFEIANFVTCIKIARRSWTNLCRFELQDTLVRFVLYPKA